MRRTGLMTVKKVSVHDRSPAGALQPGRDGRDFPHYAGLVPAEQGRQDESPGLTLPIGTCQRADAGEPLPVPFRLL